MSSPSISGVYGMPMCPRVPNMPPQALTRFAADAPLETMLEAYRTDGGFIVEAMFDRTTINAMRAAADRRAPEFPPGTATQGSPSMRTRHRPARRP